MKIEYHPAIEFELKEIIKFYNKISQRLGAEFLNEFEKQVLRISAMPTSNAVNLRCFSGG